MGCGCNGGTAAVARVVGHGHDSGLPAAIVTPQFFIEVNGRRLNRSYSSLIAASEAARTLNGSVVSA